MGAELKEVWVKGDLPTNGLRKDVSLSEIYASTVENLLRSEQNIPLRTFYDPDQSGQGLEGSRVLERSKFGNYVIPSQVQKLLSEILESRK
ncbi:MAG TPA: hypothetical protein VKB19_01830 [Pedobacter sp.]|nr:hypothetical protein [Pedobacter sp.]